MLKLCGSKYLALVRGQWRSHVKVVNAPLLKNILQSGERIVRVNSEVNRLKPVFRSCRVFATLVMANPITGRTHQIRAYAHAGHPIACDDKYGERDFDEQVKLAGFTTVILHAYRLTFHSGNC